MTTSSRRYANLKQSMVVFSQNDLPLCQVNIKRAIVPLVTNKAEALGFPTQGGWRVQLPSLVIDVPKHIRLKIASSKRMWKVLPVNGWEMLQKDDRSCQYCDSSKHPKLNPLVLRFKSGSHTWDNLVTAYERCNSRKGDCTLFEAGMQRQQALKTPVHQTIFWVKQFWINVQANLE
nr:HNH endonuclease [Dendronalium phyllosphericum]